jgi:hypothetical protein
MKAALPKVALGLSLAFQPIVAFADVCSGALDGKVYVSCACAPFDTLIRRRNDCGMKGPDAPLGQLCGEAHTGWEDYGGHPDLHGICPRFCFPLVMIRREYRTVDIIRNQFREVYQCTVSPECAHFDTGFISGSGCQSRR